MQLIYSYYHDQLCVLDLLYQTCYCRRAPTSFSKSDIHPKTIISISLLLWKQWKLENDTLIQQVICSSRYLLHTKIYCWYPVMNRYYRINM